MNFSYKNPTCIQFGEGQISSIVNFINKKDKVLLVYGGGSIKQNGVYAQVCLALKEYKYFEFSGVEANPSVETMNKALKIVREEDIDFVLAIGGGSVIDGCKYLVAAACYDGDAWDFLDSTSIVENALPLGVILTLPATGSESNKVAVLSKKATNEKRFFDSDFVFPKFAVLDPRTMTTLSDKQIANGLADAFVHVCEQYLTYPTNSLVQDGYSESLLKALITLGNTWEKRKTKNWQDNLMWIANQALNGLIGVAVPQDWASHMIGHELTALIGIDHARSLAVIQPHLLRVMFKDKKDKLRQMGENVFGIHNDAQAVIVLIENFYKNIGIKTSLKDYSFDEDSLNTILSSLNKHNMTKLGENENITLEKSSQILRLAMQ